MNSVQANAFYAGAGFSGSNISFDIKLLVGGTAVVCALLILGGLLHLLNSAKATDKTIFVSSLFLLSFMLMLIFIYVA